MLIGLICREPSILNTFSNIGRALGHDSDGNPRLSQKKNGPVNHRTDGDHACRDGGDFQGDDKHREFGRGLDGTKQRNERGRGKRAESNVKTSQGIQKQQGSFFGGTQFAESAASLVAFKFRCGFELFGEFPRPIHSSCQPIAGAHDQ